MFRQELANEIGVSLEKLEAMENKVLGKFEKQPSFFDWIDATYEMSVGDYTNLRETLSSLLFMEYHRWFDKKKPIGINMEPKPTDEEPCSWVGDLREEGIELEKIDEMIKEPEHYAKHAIEPCTFVMKNKLGFARGNVVKYTTRAGHKKYDDLSIEESEIRDLKKAARYIEMELNLLEGREIL